MIDIAPGENHTVRRKSLPNGGGVIDFYHPNLFHQSPMWNLWVPLFISDVLKATPAKEIYGTQLKEGVILVNNHPVRNFLIHGRVRGVRTRSYPYDVYDIYVDDSSGESSNVPISLTPAQFSMSKLSVDESYGTLVEAKVHRVWWGFDKVSLSGYKITVSQEQDLSTEMSYWKEHLDFRQKLLRPWVYVAPVEPAPPLPDAPFRMEARDLEQRESRKTLILTEQPEIQTIFTEDSIVIAKEHERVSRQKSAIHATSKRKSSSSNQKRSTPQQSDSLLVHDLTEDDSDVEFVAAQNAPFVSVKERQLRLEMVIWIVKKDFVRFNLSQLFHDPHISTLLSSTVKAHIAHAKITVGNVNLEDLPSKEMVFHRARHKLSKAGLIRISKQHLVKPEKLRDWYLQLQQKIYQAKLHSGAMSLDTATSDLSLGRTVLNGVIEHILTIYNDRPNWKYDRKTAKWSYSPRRDDSNAITSP